VEWTEALVAACGHAGDQHPFGSFRRLLMDSSSIVVLMTAPSIEVARQIAGVLLEDKLAACVNILPGINSLYSWQGEIQDDTEVLMLAKSRPELFEDRLIPAVQAIHPYQVPEIIALPIVMGLGSYLDWITAETQPR
jgi:periplasmic divalent cation tolerance protein